MYLITVKRKRLLLFGYLILIPQRYQTISYIFRLLYIPLITIKENFIIKINIFLSHA